MAVLQHRLGLLELEQRNDKMRARLHRRALLIAELQGANAGWQAFVQELLSAGCHRGDFLMSAQSPDVLLGVGEQQYRGDAGAYEFLATMVKYEVITPDEIARARRAGADQP
jgi:hypothetical protein